jgi:hypothetical protein
MDARETAPLPGQIATSRKLTDKQQIMEYVREFGSITPAKMSGSIYKGKMFPSEVSRRCRELRTAGMLRSVDEGRYERFVLSEPEQMTLGFYGRTA